MFVRSDERLKREKKEKKKENFRSRNRKKQQRQRETEKRGEKVPPAPVFFGSRRCMAFFG